MRVVWFKRDLRITDHRPLAAAAETGDPVRCVYFYEPDYWRLPDVDVRHLTCVNHAVAELRRSLRSIGSELILVVGDVVETFGRWHRDTPIRSLHSHEETGNDWTYRRDRDVQAFCREHSIAWIEEVQNGVVRRLKSRDGWAKRWNQRMNEPLTATPKRIVKSPVQPIGRVASPKSLGLPANPNADEQQRATAKDADELLTSFLHDRGQRYHKEMSSPVTAMESCSRMSVHLVYGTMSMREVFQRWKVRRDEVRRLRDAGDKAAAGTWPSALNAYGARLRWHCHFMQKLEDQPDLEWENFSRVYDSLRDPQPDPVRFAAWRDGQTGFPMIDACMRSVAVTGYLNFRMRAMVVSFASYHLWLHWRQPSIYLARMFTDYEPGIHYSQFQMQSGTTGINTVRIYSPIKQVKDHDPEGIFIRRWVPELANVPKKYLSQPETMPTEVGRNIGCVIGQDYPPPIVDHPTAYREAREKIYGLRRQHKAREEADAVLKKHGSRKGGDRRMRKAKTSKG